MVHVEIRCSQSTIVINFCFQPFRRISCKVLTALLVPRESNLLFYHHIHTSHPASYRVDNITSSAHHSMMIPHVPQRRRICKPTTDTYFYYLHEFYYFLCYLFPFVYFTMSRILVYEALLLLFYFQTDLDLQKVTYLVREAEN